MAVKLILIRHGQTDCNLEKRYSGFMDIELNDTGKFQVELLSSRIKLEPIDRVYCSDRKRAVQSAEIIFKNRDKQILPDLREINFGVFEGLTYKEIIERYPEVSRKWFEDPFNNNIPEGEALYDFEKRVLISFERIIKDNKGNTVAVVSHGGTISILINAILKQNDFWKQIPGSASMSTVEYNGDAARIRVFNDTSHLV